MTNHAYVGKLACCLQCFKPLADSIHDVSKSASVLPARPSEPTPVERVLREPAPHTHTCLGCGAKRTHTDLGCLDPATVQFCPLCAERRILQNAAKQDPNAAKAITCPGHECPTCKKTWTHNYNCTSRKTGNGLCERCAQEAAVEIGRPQTIEQLAMLSSSNLSGWEVSKIFNAHSEFVTKNLILDENGVERPDWYERINVHRRELKKQIEMLRIHEHATSKVVVDKMTEDMTKLSPEEIEQYKRDAKKQAGGKKESAKKADSKPQATPQEAANKAYADLLKGITTKLRNTTHRNSSPDEVIKEAEKRAEAMMKMMEDN